MIDITNRASELVIPVEMTPVSSLKAGTDISVGAIMVGA